MAAAYAAFTSLMNLLTQLHDHPRTPIQVEEKQFDSLSSNICFFQRFLEDHHITIDHELEIRIADAAQAAEDLIETHMADRVPDFYRRLQRLIEGMDCIKQEVTEMNLNEPSHQRHNRPTPYPTPQTSSQSPSAVFGEDVVVGIEDITVDIVDKLTSSQRKSDRQIISISGMGGIGKTTLARKVYDHQYIKDYFDFFAWATISKDYNTRESLLEILRCLYSFNSKESFREKSEYELGEQMYQYLIGRRYLVVVDDIWDLEAWDRLKSYFPACSGSGIVITTRESKFVPVSSHSFRMNLLDEHNSWNLLCKHAFGQNCCPLELEKVGKMIANKCRALPLSIVVIGSHLAKSTRTLKSWEYIAKNLSSVVNSEDNERCLKIVSLSYTHLPVHLKPCFLYMAIFSEDEVIQVSRLIRLWVVEGFVKPINGKSLDDVAKDYLNDLSNRNLILASRSSRRGRIKSFKIHDILRDFCLKEAAKKNFLCIVQKWEDLGVLNNERRIVFHLSALKETSTRNLVSGKELPDNIGTRNKEPTEFIVVNEPVVDCHNDISIVLKARVFLRTLILYGELPSLENKLLRVLNSINISHTRLLEVLHRHVNTRYFNFKVIDEIDNLPSSISLLWNLQSLIITNRHRCIKAPPEIWKMPQLRHINARLFLPHPPSESDGTMKNLRLARVIRNFSFCEEELNRILDIKKLMVDYFEDYEGFEEASCTLNNISLLRKLESFSCLIKIKNVEKCFSMFRNISFPHSLKKLIIEGIRWDDVTTKIGSLPLLEVLKLHVYTGHEWNLIEGQFLNLKSLELTYCFSLQKLTANNNHFPCLQRMVLTFMEGLEEISSEIGDIIPLKSIELNYCPDSTVISAENIAAEQCDLGNEELQVTARLLKGSTLSENLISTSNFHVI